MNERQLSRRDMLTVGLTGAVLASSAAASTAPAAGAGRVAETTHSTEVLVVGGGPAGMAAATMAARLGCQVLLAERYGRMGGMAVQGMVGPLMGSIKSPFVDEVLQRVGGRHFDSERLDLQYASVVRESGATLWLHSWAAETCVEDRHVTGVRLLSKQGMIRVTAPVIVDATGDGDVAALAGAAFEQGRPGDGLVQPVSIMYRLAGVDEAQALVCGSEEEAHKVRVPEGSWCEVVTRGQKSGELASTIGVIRLYRANRPGERVVNAAQVNGIDGTKVEDLTRAELEGREQAYQVLDFVRKHAPGYDKAYIAAMPMTVGVRETRRILGVRYLTRDDCTSGRKWPDAVVRSASFPIDIHNPSGSGQAEGEGPQGRAARVKPYDIPYGCLVPREIDGLLLAGRCISGSHHAHASYRVQCIAMAIGAAAGAAAATAFKQGVLPRNVDVAQVQAALNGA
jgi:hypothetical protein